MKDTYYIIDTEEQNQTIKLKEVLLRYLQYWPWFLVTMVLAMIIGFIYLRYAPNIYASNAKIKIIDETKELDITSDALSLLGGGSKINLDNEIEILKSYRLLEQVVSSLNLEISYYEVGTIKTRQIFETPFKIVKLFSDDSLKKPVTYQFNFELNPPTVTDSEGNVQKLQEVTTNFLKTKFPIKIERNITTDLSSYRSNRFNATISKKKETILELAKKLEIKATNKNSEILSLKLKGESPKLSEVILNELLYKFDQDGILDRQLVSKRTLDFIDERFIFLSKELDSIEVGKEEFKKTNNLSYIEADAGMTIQQKSTTQNEVFEIETQVALSKLLRESLTTKNSYELLPADIGLENASINNLVAEYNQTVLEREKLISSAGENNPTVKILSDRLSRGKQNILSTVNVYRNQLKVSLKQLRQERNRAGAAFSSIPEKEKILRSIERQQSIKENLFLLLLQKREEAAINFAVTSPSIKVVDYGLTGIKPITPKKPLVLIGALILGLLAPFSFFTIKFALDTKIKGKSDIEKIVPQIPILAEIPSLKDPLNFFTFDERSVKAESFRILATNLNYLLPKKNISEAQVIHVTSAIKGEGKTLVSANLAIALCSLKRKVLLVGADLRNPRLHNFFDLDKNEIGLSNYLYNHKIDWKTCIQKKILKNPFLDICLSGPIPPNSSQLIASKGMEKLLANIKKEYDYIVFDTAPTALVADTLLMSEYADLTIFLTRVNYTEKRLIEFSKELNETKKLKNMAYVVNDMAYNKRKGYNYGYEYGYHSDEKK